MSTVVLDANVLVSHLTKRDELQQEKAHRLLARAADDEIGILLSEVSLSEVVYVLDSLYRQPPRIVAEFVGDVFRQRGLEVVSTTAWSRVFDLWPSELRDFADAVVLGVALDRRAQHLATFDRALARVAARHGVTSPW